VCESDVCCCCFCWCDYFVFLVYDSCGVCVLNVVCVCGSLLLMWCCCLLFVCFDVVCGVCVCV
jgi:hypothetical protein